MEMGGLLKASILWAVVALLSVSAAWAGPYEDGVAAAGNNNFAEAAKLYRVAAEQGDVRAQGALGSLLELGGHGLSQNYVEAAKWYRLAAEQGAAASQVFLGTMYRDGRGVPLDYVVSYMWLNLASASSISLAETAAYDRDTLAKKMTPQQISEAQKLTRECQQRNFKGCY